MHLHELASYILQHPGATQDELARVFNVTTRTIRTYITNLKNATADFLCVQTKKDDTSCTMGYYLEITQQDAYNDWLIKSDRLANPQENLSHADRVSYLIYDLLDRDGWITAQKLSEILHVSRATLSNDFKEVERVLASTDLILEKSQSKGFRIVGSEESKRILFANKVLASIMHTSETSHNVAQRFHLEEIAHIVSSVLKDSHVKISETMYQNLLIHLAIALMRINKKCYIQPDINTQLADIVSDDALEIARTISCELEKHFQISIPESETAYIALHLASHRSVLHPEQNDNLVISDEVWNLVEQMLDCVHTTYDFDFHNDIELRMNLACHLTPLILRMRFDMKITNPLLPDIKQRYPLGWALAVEASSVLVQAYAHDLSDDEVGYIALAFALALERMRTEIPKKNILVVCASGMGSSKMLEYKYRKEFAHYVDQIITCDVAHLDDVVFENIDYIFSTVPIKKKLPCPVCEVKFFLDDADIQYVKDILSREEHPAITQLPFNEKLFIPHAHFSSMEDALMQLSQRFQSIGISDNFYSLVCTREQTMSTAIGNGVAIPHPIEATSKHLHVLVALLDEPILWGNRKVDIVFMASLPRAQENNQNFFQLLADVCMDRKALDTLLENRSFSALKQIFSSRGVKANSKKEELCLK